MIYISTCRWRVGLLLVWFGLIVLQFGLMVRSEWVTRDLDWRSELGVGVANVWLAPGAMIALGLFGLAGLVILRSRWPQTILPLLALGVLLGCSLLLVTSGQLWGALMFVWLALVALVVGLALVDALRLQADPVSDILLAFAFGYGSLGLLALLLGSLGWLTRPVVWTLTLPLALTLGLGRGRRLVGWGRDAWSVWRDRSPPTWPALGCLMLLAAFVVVNWIGVLAPDTKFDALRVHLALARIFAESGRVEGLPYLTYSYWPIQGHMLLTLGYVVGGETAAKLFHFSAGLLTTGFVYRLAQTDLTPRPPSLAGKGGKAGAGSSPPPLSEEGLGEGSSSPVSPALLAATIFYTTPIIAWESTTAYLDLFLMLWLGGALLLLTRWMDRPPTADHGPPKEQFSGGRSLSSAVGLAVGIGLALGFALGVKISAALWAIGVGLLMLWAAWRWPHTRVTSLQSLGMAMLVSAMVGGVWYLRAYLLTGNPVFPFLNTVFRSPLLSPRDAWFNFADYGIGRSVTSFFTWPWQLTFETGRFGEVVHGAAGVAFLVGLPCLALVRRWPIHLQVVAWVSLVYALGWFASVQYLRYLLPALVGAAALAAWGLMALQQAVTLTWPRWTGILWVAILSLLAVNLPLNLVQYRQIPTRVPYPVVLGHQSREAYLTTVVPDFAAYQYLNRHLATHDRVYSIEGIYQYFSAAPIVAPVFAAASDAILFAPDEATALHALADACITHLLLYRPNMAQWDTVVHAPTFLGAEAQRVFEANGFEIYRLPSPAILNPLCAK